MIRSRFIFIVISLLAIVILASSFTDFGDVLPAISDPTAVSTTTTTAEETTTTTAEETATTTTETTADTTTATTTTTAEETATTTTTIPTPIGELSADMVKRIKSDWMVENPVSDRPAEYIKLTYYGTYGDCVVLSIHDYGLQYVLGGPSRDDIAGVSFFYPQAYDLWVWNNGEFCHLREAYAKGWVSKVDVQNVAYYFNSR